MGRRRYTPPFEVTIDRIGKKGMGWGVAPDGLPVMVKPGPPGATLLVAPQGKKRGAWKGRRVELLTPPPDYIEPPCPVFGLCGGCVLQEIPLEAQRRAKMDYALGCVAEPLGVDPAQLGQEVVIHPVRGAQESYHYRNKVELSFGNRRMLSQEAFDAGALIDGRFLGFHAPGRFDRIADAERCWLMPEEANALLSVLREHTLAEDALSCWDAREHTGFWRHVMIRHAVATNELLLILYTSPATQEVEVQAVEGLAKALMEAPLPNEATLVGVRWLENDKVADVAQGVLRQQWGREWIEERLGETCFRIAAPTFFQVTKAGAEILYDTIGEALGEASGTLYDLYCGIGSIGLYLASSFERIVGVEEVEASVVAARENAAANDIEGASFYASKMEDMLEVLSGQEERRALVVDPPRAGLHPRVARALATTSADVLVYVACEPASLGRDIPLLREGGWELRQLWVVDLFPQTGHVEMVAQFLRPSA